MKRSERWLSGARPYLLLAGLCLLLYAPGLSAIPPLDRDEARFAQATRQMLQTGDFLRIRFQSEARNNKPAGIYWLQAAAVGVVSTPESTAIWPYRLPSLIGATAAALLVFGFGAALLSETADPPTARRIAMAAALLLASALGVVAEAHIAKTDAALLAAVTAGQGALGLAYVRCRAGKPCASWLAAGSGPPRSRRPCSRARSARASRWSTAATLSIADGDLRWLRGLRPVAGIIAMVLALAPWLIAIEHATAGRFLAGSLGRDFMTKLLGGQESHGAPPFSYLLLAFATFWPGSLLLVPALVRGWRRHERPPERFFLAWLVPGWVFLELVPTNLPHYVLPLYPALALLAGAALADGASFAATTWARRAELLAAGLWTGVTLALAASLIGLPLRFGNGPTLGDVVGAVLLVFLAAATIWYRPGASGTTGLMAALSLAFVVPVTVGVLPRLDRLWLSRSAAALVIGIRRAGHAARRGRLQRTEPRVPARRRCASRHAVRRGRDIGPGGEALVGNRDQAMFLQAVAARRLVAARVGSVAGIDYSNGQHLLLTLYTIAPGMT